MTVASSPFATMNCQVEISKRQAQAEDMQRVSLPGFGLDLQQDEVLPIAQDWYASPIMVRERTMISLMLALKDKTEWGRKVFDEDIVSKWKKEALEFAPERGPENDTAGPWRSEQNGAGLDLDGVQRQKVITDEVFEYCIAELRDNAKTYQQRGFTEAIDANACVYISDSAISAESKTTLAKAVLPLENVREDAKDWHPGSQGKVLDLVHPSLFPLIYGRTRVLPAGSVPLQQCSDFTGLGEIVPSLESTTEGYGSFQWLPCEVSMQDGRARIQSYINNLHPAAHQDLYHTIEEVITASVPMWVQTILSTSFRGEQRLEFKCPSGWIDHTAEANLNEDDDDYYDRREAAHEVELPQPKEYRSRQRVSNDFFEDEEFTHRLSDIGQSVRNCSKVPSDETRAAEQVKLQAETLKLENVFGKDGFQVIVKLANIHLTPEKPSYDGGSWHIEGQLNEHICASALYYYDSENVTDSYLAFREGVDRDELNNYEQNRYEALMEIYGIKDDWGPAIQNLGMVHTKEGRLLTFPNVLQHCVTPFELQDKTKPGHRKLLALFLVDPFIRIPSTANVPPQQMQWWKEAMEQKGSLTQRLPVELADHIVEGVEDFPISLDEAKKIRQKLIEERKVFVDQSMMNYVENGYCFCEH